jgi:hypothetical protein
LTDQHMAPGDEPEQCAGTGVVWEAVGGG